MEGKSECVLTNHSPISPREREREREKKREKERDRETGDRSGRVEDERTEGSGGGS